MTDNTITRPAAEILQMRPTRKMRVISILECSGYCPHSNSCTRNPAIPHKLHICSNKDCPCHGRARYEGMAEVKP
jgi:hypothetical protein